MDPNRKEHLLFLAQRSRRLWVIDSLNPEMRKKVLSGQSYMLNLPKLEGVQETLDYLTDIVGDGLRIDLRSLYLSNQEAQGHESLVVLDRMEVGPYISFVSKLGQDQYTMPVSHLQRFALDLQKTVTKMRLDGNGSLSDDHHNYLSTEIWTCVEETIEKLEKLEFYSDPRDLVDLKYFVERFVFEKVHGFIFAADTKDVLADRVLSNRMESLQFLSPEHLDINDIFTKSSDNEEIKSVLAGATDGLQNLVTCKCPSQMIESIKHSSGNIGLILHNASVRRQSESGDDSQGKPAGTDDFLPLMILALKETQPPRLKSTITFLERYLHPSKLVSEHGFLLTQLISAVNFLETVDAEVLTISPREFERALYLAQEKASKTVAEEQSMSYKTEESPSKPPLGALSVSAPPILPAFEGLGLTHNEVLHPPSTREICSRRSSAPPVEELGLSHDEPRRPPTARDIYARRSKFRTTYIIN